MISGVSRCDGPGEIAEIDLKVALSMGSKMSGNSYENQCFLGSAGARDQAESQKLTLQLPSVWGAKCMEIHMKINDFWGQQVRRARRTRRNRS